MLQACDELLQPERFKDYGPNGLQVEAASRCGGSSPASPPAGR
jgi:hypothetical protein